jgi:hypothetical protein
MLKLLIPLIENANNKSICINVPDFLQSAYWNDTDIRDWACDLLVKLTELSPLALEDN